MVGPCEHGIDSSAKAGSSQPEPRRKRDQQVTDTQPQRRGEGPKIENSAYHLSPPSMPTAGRRLAWNLEV